MTTHIVRGWAHVCVCTLYVPLVVWATWPIARHATDHVLDAVALHGPFGWLVQADIMLHTWILSWDVHAVLTDPASLLDANIFYPARWALARSEHEIGDVLLFAPFYLLSENPVFAHQMAMLSTYVLAATAMYVAVWRWLGRVDAAFVAGALFALAPARLTALAHIQTLPVMYLPLIVLAGLEVLAGGRRRWWVALAGAILLQALSSAYLGVLAFATALATLAGRILAAPTVPMARAVRYLTAVASAGIAASGAYWPYAWLQGTGAIPAATRAVREAFSARPIASYVPGLGDPDATARFVSAPAFVLALCGLVLWKRIPTRPCGAVALRELRVALIAVILTGYILSLGPTLHVGGWELPLPFRFLSFLPGLGAFRGPGRFGTLVGLGTSVLAAVGLVALARADRSPPLRAAMLLVALLGLAAEIGAFSFPLRPVAAGSRVPPVYRWLAEHGGNEPVLEVPVGVDFRDYSAMYAHSRYTYFSTYHWNPLLNGYSAYPPESFHLLMAVARRLPAADALHDLANVTGLRWIVLHRDALTPRARARWGGVTVDGLAEVARFDGDVVYRVDMPATVDLRDRLAWPAGSPRTLSGLDVVRLEPPAMRGDLRDLTVPPALKRDLLVEAWVTVENQSAHTWAGFRPESEGLVHVGYRWLDAAGRSIDIPAQLARIPRDLEPGDALRVPFGITTPHAVGRHTLHVTLVQKGGAWFDELGGPVARTAVDIRP
jgi:hypothetical protein